MYAAYREWDYKGRETIPSVATQLYKNRPFPSYLSPLIFMTDPARIPDVKMAIARQPPGTAIIYRHFGRENKLSEAEELRQITFEREQQFLIGADPELAVKVGADGVHFRRDSKVGGPALWRQRCPDWLITMAGLKLGHYEGELSALDGLLISSVFPSQSPSAGAPIGLKTFKQNIQDIPVPLFALGGINKETAPKLLGSGAAGIAGIGLGLSL